MRTEEERLEQIRKRATELRRKDQKRRQMILDIGCVAACLLLVSCMGLVMPGLADQAQYGQIRAFSSGAASVFGNSGASGYIFIGILSFLLGVCVTIFMYRIHHRNREKNPDEF